MTILTFLTRLYADIQHNNALAGATHKQENRQKEIGQPKRGKPKGWQK